MCIYVFPTPEDNDSSNPFLQKRYHASIQIDIIKEMGYTNTMLIIRLKCNFQRIKVWNQMLECIIGI